MILPFFMKKKLVSKLFLKEYIIFLIRVCCLLKTKAKFLVCQKKKRNLSECTDKGRSFQLQFRESFRFKISKKENKKSGLDIPFGSSNRFGLNVFGLTVLYCITKISRFENVLYSVRKKC